MKLRSLGNKDGCACGSGRKGGFEDPDQRISVNMHSFWTFSDRTRMSTWVFLRTTKSLALAITNITRFCSGGDDSSPRQRSAEKGEEVEEEKGRYSHSGVPEKHALRDDTVPSRAAPPLACAELSFATGRRRRLSSLALTWLDGSHKLWLRIADVITQKCGGIPLRIVPCLLSGR